MISLPLFSVKCNICPHNCDVSTSISGKCKSKYVDQLGIVKSAYYGQIFSMSVQPIQKKPITQYMSGTKVLSVGLTSGCNLDCGFCQNWSVSQKVPKKTKKMSPQQICKVALSKGAEGVCVTYNEPSMNHQFCIALFEEAHRNGLYTALKTNGYVSPDYWQMICRSTDAMNIDFKGSSRRYQSLGAQAGAAEVVIKSINRAVRNGCHVQISIPVSNDFDQSDISPLERVQSSDIGIHLLKIVPAYKQVNNSSTSADKILSVSSHLNEFMGNILTQ